MLVKLRLFILFYFFLSGDLYIPLAIQLSNGLALASRLEVVPDSKWLYFSPDEQKYP